MTINDDPSNIFPQKEATIALGVLNAVEEDEHVTQRQLAGDLGIALGLANTYLKRCIKKGFIKVTQVPARRYAYYLTPRGFREKSRLTAEYLTQSFKLFRDARGQYAEIFETCTAKNQQRILFAGAGDLAEIALLSAQECNITPLGLLEPQSSTDTFIGLRVASDPSAFGEIDVVVITDFRTPQATFESLARSVRKERIAFPPLLGIITDWPDEEPTPQ